MQLSLQTFSTLVQNAAAAVQGASNQLLDLTVGSTLRAVLEANASVALWMQWLILQVLRMTRAATSNGADLDSWMADFSLTRLPAAAATGLVTFSRFSPAMSAVVPVGALVRTADGTQTFQVVEDTANAAWTPGSNGYSLASGVASVDVCVMAQTAGGTGNVLARTVSLLASAIPGIDAVTNADAFQNGVDAEADAAFLARFRNFIASRSRATPLAVGYAVGSIQQGLSYTIQENRDASGVERMGWFVVTIDDGSGSPSSMLLSIVQAAVDAVRPIGSSFVVRSPLVITANVSMTITVSDGSAKAQIASSVGNAIEAYVTRLSIGTTLPLTKLAEVAYSVNSSVINVSQLQINGGTDDIQPPVSGVVKPGTIVVN
jgi:uncharacterized phage protein gp47/JayE